MEDTGIRMVFSGCDICEKPYDEDEKKIRDASGEYSDENSDRQEPLLLLCNSCGTDLGVLPTFNP
jgi:hypothetical protein